MQTFTHPPNTRAASEVERKLRYTFSAFCAWAFGKYHFCVIKYILSLLQIFLFVDLFPQLYTSKVHYCNTNQYEKDLFFTVFTDRSVKNPEQVSATMNVATRAKQTTPPHTRSSPSGLQTTGPAPPRATGHRTSPHESQSSGADPRSSWWLLRRR